MPTRPQRAGQSAECQPGGEAQSQAPGSGHWTPRPSLTHSPVEFIVVIVDFPPEVEPGECEAKRDCEEQEPEAFPLEEQRRKGVRGSQGLAPRPPPPQMCLSPPKQGLLPAHTGGDLRLGEGK